MSNGWVPLPLPLSGVLFRALCPIGGWQGTKLLTLSPRARSHSDWAPLGPNARWQPLEMHRFKGKLRLIFWVHHYSRAKCQAKKDVTCLGFLCLVWREEKIFNKQEEEEDGIWVWGNEDPGGKAIKPNRINCKMIALRSSQWRILSPWRLNPGCPGQPVRPVKIISWSIQLENIRDSQYLPDTSLTWWPLKRSSESTMAATSNTGHWVC